MTAFLSAAWTVTLELAPWLLLGAAVAGVLHVVLPRDFVRRRLRGRSGVLGAALLGVPLPLCSCGVIPAGLGLKKDGASNGAAVAFLVSTPQTGVDSVLVSASFLGWPFALFKVASAFGLGLLGGFWADAVDPGLRAVDGSDVQTGRRTWREGLDHALEMIETIWRWLVFGILVSAALTTFVPPGAFTSLSAYGGALAMAAMLVIALPLYVCATASVPIAAALIAGGFPPGAALVFLMAGPATNLATVGAVRRAFGTKTLAIYLTTIGVGSVALGWAFDFVLADRVGVRRGLTTHHDPGVVTIATTVLFVGMLGWFALADLRRFVKRRLAPAPGRSEPVELAVDGLTCNGCVRKLETQLRSIPNVGAVEVTLEPRGLARVEGVDREALECAIRAAGYEPAGGALQ